MAGKVFGDVPGDVFGDVFGDGDAAAVADMESQTQRQVFTVKTSPIQGLPILDAITYAEALVVNTDFDEWDWSGCSIIIDDPLLDGGITVTYSLAKTLISDTHFVCSDHNKGNVGQTVYFRKPNGDIVSADVAEYRDDDFGDLRLGRLDANPSADLARYAIPTDASFKTYLMNPDAMHNPLWLLDHDMDVRLRLGSAWADVGALGNFTHVNSSWNNVIGTGSGRPCFIALDDGSLILVGTISSGSLEPRISKYAAAIQTLLDDHTETLVTVEIPATAADLEPGPANSNWRRKMQQLNIPAIPAMS